MKGKRKAINEIMTQFNWRECKDVMMASQISWKNSDGMEYIPSIEELKMKAESMLKKALEPGTNYCKISGNNLVVVKRSTSIELFFVIDHKWA